jgi:hypothetical protein
MDASLARDLFGEHVKPLVKRAVAGLLISVGLTLAVFLPVAIGGAVLAHHPGQLWRGLLAFLVTTLAFAIAGPALAVKRAVGDAVLFGLQKLRIGDRTTAMLFDRMGIHAVDRAGERGSALVQKVERVPLATAEQYLRDAVDFVVRQKEGGGGGFFQRRIRQTLVEQVQKLTLARFRTHDKELPGVDLRRVRVEVAERADAALEEVVGGALLKTTLLVLGLTSLGCLLVAYGIRSIS